MGAGRRNVPVGRVTIIDGDGVPNGMDRQPDKPRLN
jgi:hypothetical protein